MAIDAQITHATRKMNNALKTKEDVVKIQETSQAKVDALQKELVAVKRAADAAQGAFLAPFPCLFSRFSHRYCMLRGTKKSVPRQYGVERGEFRRVSQTVCPILLAFVDPQLDFLLAKSLQTSSLLMNASHWKPSREMRRRQIGLSRSFGRGNRAWRRSGKLARRITVPRRLRRPRWVADSAWCTCPS